MIHKTTWHLVINNNNELNISVTLEFLKVSVHPNYNKTFSLIEILSSSLGLYLPEWQRKVLKTLKALRLFFIVCF